MAKPGLIRALTVSLILLMQSVIAFAQQFETVSAAFAGVGRGEIAWCDYDNDHDLDIFMTGRGGGDQRISLLYRNDEGQFSETGASFIAVDESMISWGDYDLDGDQDLLLAGNSENGDITRIYRNDNGTFNEIDPGIPGIQQGVVQWVDIDGDSDLDIFISGSWITEVYMNDNGAFVDGNQDFGYFSSSAASFGDFDNDGDLDLLISGDSGAGALTRVFRNTQGSFDDTGLEFPGLLAGTADWVDYDHDGDLDAAISGFNDALEAEFFIYANQDKQFEAVNVWIEGFALGSADWGDFDNDGDPDLVMSGKGNGCGAYVSGIYRNDGNNFFFKISQELSITTRGSLGWADYDNDGDLDFMMAGLSSADIPFSKLYMNLDGNNVFAANTPPGEPGALEAFADAGQVMLSWSGSTDNQTPSAGLSYNFRLGTSPGANNIVPPMADPANGYRQVTNPGNAGQVNYINISGLSPGTYYWSVQAIDHSMEGSAFAPEQSFEIIATGTSENKDLTDHFRIYPNPVKDHLIIENAGNFSSVKIALYDLTGQVLFSDVSSESVINIGVAGLKPGTYLLTLVANKIPTGMLIVKSK
jgi:hypothetical protein